MTPRRLVALLLPLILPGLLLPGGVALCRCSGELVAAPLAAPGVMPCRECRTAAPKDAACPLCRRTGEGSGVERAPGHGGSCCFLVLREGEHQPLKEGAPEEAAVAAPPPPAMTAFLLPAPAGVRPARASSLPPGGPPLALAPGCRPLLT